MPSMSARGDAPSRGPIYSSEKSIGHVGAVLSRDDSTLHLPDPDDQDHQQHQSGALTARQTSATLARQGNKAEFAKLQKKKEHALKHEKVLAMRERDEADLKERASREQQKREARFQDMMNEVRHNDSVRVECAHIIQNHEQEQEKKRHNLWSQWDKEVSQRIECQLSRFMTRTTPREGYREELRASDDPAKRSLVEQRQEDNFRRIADSIIGRDGLPKVSGLKEQAHMRDTIEQTVAHRTTTRPVLPVELWGQQELFAGPYGYFAQRCEKMDRGEPFHSTRRMGVDRHLPPEQDGVQAAGKKKVKNRLATKYNHMGVLHGVHGKVGEAYMFKRPHGAGSAAPMQDHYFYEKGNDIVESEFPVGKKCFQQLAHEK